MSQDPITQQCFEMNDQDLVRALTLDKEYYRDQFREIASRELARREVNLSELVDRIEVTLNNQESEICTIDQALSKLKKEASLWDIWIFTNCLDESLVLQKERLRWMIHHYSEEKYEKSFFVEIQEDVKELLSRFLCMKDWKDYIDRVYNLNKWKTLVRSKSHKYITKITSELEAAKVTYTVQTPIYSHDSDESLSILVPDEYMKIANNIIEENENRVLDLYIQASKLAKSGDLTEELEIYNLLTQSVSDNPAIFYNRGSILFELGCYEEAADSFIEAVSLGMEDTEDEIKFGREKLSRGLVGMIGLGGLFFKKTHRPNDEYREYPEFIDDAELFLMKILEIKPRAITILHCLAAISRLKKDITRAKERYNRILSIKPSDSIAHLNLEVL